MRSVVYAQSKISAGHTTYIRSGQNDSSVRTRLRGISAAEHSTLTKGKPCKNTIAFSDNDVATIAWSYGKRPVGCMGFHLPHRQQEQGDAAAQPRGIQGDTIKAGQTTAEFRFRSSTGRIAARLVAERPATANFAKSGSAGSAPHHLKAMTSLPHRFQRVEVSPTSAGISAYFVAD
jgi:hypothetical protein